MFGPVLGPVFIFIGSNMWNPHITATPNMRRCMWDDMVTFCSVSGEKISMNLSTHELSPTRPAQCRSDTEYLVFLIVRYVSFICILLFDPVLGPVFIFIGLNMWNPHITAIPNMRRCMWDDMVTCCSVSREKTLYELIDSSVESNPTGPV